VFHAAGSKKGVTETEEIIAITPEDQTIDLTALVKDEILLSAPIKPLCSNHCKGLCSHCGRDLNIGTCRCTELPQDSPWEPLGQLKARMN